MQSRFEKVEVFDLKEIDYFPAETLSYLNGKLVLAAKKSSTCVLITNINRFGLSAHESVILALLLKHLGVNYAITVILTGTLHFITNIESGSKVQHVMFKGVTSYGLRSGRDAILIPKPYIHYGAIQEMIHAIDEQIGIQNPGKLDLNVFDGFSSPSKLEFVITQRININVYAVTEVTIVEALRSLGVNSFIVSQSRSLSERSEDLAKRVGDFVESVTSELLIKAFNKIERKYFAKMLAVEQSYKATEDFAKALYEKYCACLLKDSPKKLAIVIH